MTREEKRAVVTSLKGELERVPHFYLVDIEGLNAQETSALRRKCFESDLRLTMVKNTLFALALKELEVDYLDDLASVLNGSTSVIFSEVGNAPARLIKEFRKSGSKPLLKAAYVEESLYIGDDQLESLSVLKSREELIADVVHLLRSPMDRVVSGLQGGGQTLHGLLKTLGERDAA